MTKKIDREAIIAKLRHEALSDPHTGWLSDLARKGLDWSGNDEVIMLRHVDGSVDVGHLAGVVEHLIADATNPLLSRLEQAEARVKLLESGIVSEFVVTSVHSASAIGTTVSGISEALLQLGYDGLAERLEQAEKNADTYQTLYEQRAESLDQAEQAVARVRALCMTTDGDLVCPDFDGNTVGDILRALDGEQA